MLIFSLIQILVSIHTSRLSIFYTRSRVADFAKRAPPQESHPMTSHESWFPHGVFPLFSHQISIVFEGEPLSHAMERQASVGDEAVRYSDPDLSTQEAPSGSVWMPWVYRRVKSRLKDDDYWITCWVVCVCWIWRLDWKLLVDAETLCSSLSWCYLCIFMLRRVLWSDVSLILSVQYMCTLNKDAGTYHQTWKLTCTCMVWMVICSTFFTSHGILLMQSLNQFLIIHSQ